jgi:hypothetical protein
MVQDCKYVTQIICAECGEGSVHGVNFRDPIALLADLRRGRQCIHEVVVRNVVKVEEAHDLSSELRLIDERLRIIQVNGYGIKTCDKVPVEHNSRGQEHLVGVASQIGGLFVLDVKITGKLD